MSGSITRIIVNSVRRLYPEALADKSWDNTGLLLEVPRLPSYKPKGNKHVVLLTIDLTRAVATEAIEKGAAAIVSYHPIIFKPLLSLTLGNTQQESLLRLTQAGISVYSPHTAVDATLGGVNDWLADGISGGRENEAQREVLVPSNSTIEGREGSGMGRLIMLKKEAELGTLVERVKKSLGMKHLMVVRAPRHVSGHGVTSIALCAGSGGSMFKNLNVDLFFTGELSHHEALAARERGISVISCFHTNTERGFLSAVMKPKLQDVFVEQWAKLKETTTEELEGDGLEVVVSIEDRDPYEII